jgi:hypothetical protein
VRVTSGGKSEAELTKAARPKKLPTGWFDEADIEDVVETTSQNNNDMFKSTVSFVDHAGEKWSVIAYLLDTPKTALLFRHACAARGAEVLAKFEAGSVDASDLLGPVRVELKIRKQKGWPDRLEVEDFAPPASSVVALHRNAG